MICNFMIFSESVGSGASLSAGKNCKIKIPVKHNLQGFFIFDV